MPPRIIVAYLQVLLMPFCIEGRGNHSSNYSSPRFSRCLNLLLNLFLKVVKLLRQDLHSCYISFFRAYLGCRAIDNELPEVVIQQINIEVL